MERSLQGRFLVINTVGESVKAFIPSPLPPVPPVEWTPQLRSKFDQALIEIGRLDGISALLPDISVLLYMYIRQEAVLSSMIEGTQSSLSDLLRYEVDQAVSVPLDDVEEVSNYVAALNFGLRRLSEGMPVSLRLLREIHGVLLHKGRGSSKTPGEFRRSQNWIGGTRPGNAAYVPPPPPEMLECMYSLELFLNDQPSATQPLLKAALAHVQFETIHPFLEGNGRLGRLLITLLLCEQGMLHEPLLYLSLYFKTHRQQYYELLNHVRLTGDWESWLEFFADAVTTTAVHASATARNLLKVANQDRERIRTLGRVSASALLVHNALMKKPVATMKSMMEQTDLSAATIGKVFSHLEKLGIIGELTGNRRNRLYCYSSYLRTMEEGTRMPSEQ